MCLTKNVLHHFPDKFVIFIIDDILVYSNNEENYAEQLTTVLRLLTKHMLYAKLSRCRLFQTQIH